MVNYNNGKIYKIVCNKTGLIYIGSTTKNTIQTRLKEHEGRFKKKYRW
jgi:predicted GIY-YIG superfamily endonuclease